MTQHSFRARLPWGLPVLSGVLIGTSYIPFPPWASLVFLARPDLPFAGFS